MSTTAPAPTTLDHAFDALLEAADRVALELRSTAAERDRGNAAPRAEIELLRRHDLLQAQEPVEYGGAGLTFAQAAQLVRRIARGDTSIAHLLGYHYAQTRVAQLFGTPEQADAISRTNAAERTFWGGVQNPRGGSALVLTQDGDGYRLNGSRTFASGASLGDHLSITVELEGELAFVSLPSDTPGAAFSRPGFVARDDWDNVGQRLTDSGGVEFHDVRVERSEILGAVVPGEEGYPAGAAPSAYQTLVTPHWQLAFVNFYVGTAEGAIDEAQQWARANGSAWETSGVEVATDDAYVLEHLGEIVTEVRAAALLADRAGEALQAALDVGPELTDEARAEAAVAVYEAKVLSTKVALSATSRLFEIQGARATTTAYGFDRHWRNVRTHTVHDPVAYKAREVGDWSLNRRAPEFSLYR
ncbi:acyl-CoA dehydrogenase family protein [Patulibacter minatonensis]|uniref:acyl-CoA dehydrogenase family protein n=1 Tax=Patulibacter minatonensis TaxID=298163 RepID=UPI000569E4BF|nr:acyl-CoA dehydrogenase family protein [Patulibacter minatonensis]